MSRKIWLRAGGAFTALALVITGCYVFLWLARAAETTSFAYTGQVSRIEVNLNVGELTLSAGSAGEISGRQELIWSMVKPTVRRRWDAARQTLTLDVGCQGRFGGRFALAMRCSAAFSLNVPPEASVQATTDSGDVTVRNMRGGLDLSSRAGDITVSGAASPWVRAETTSGEVNVGCATAPSTVTATTVSGNVLVTVPRATSYAVEAKTRSGFTRAEVGNHPSATHRITATATSGNVMVRYPD